MSNSTTFISTKTTPKKSMGFKSGNVGGHFSLLWNLGKWHWHQTWIFSWGVRWYILLEGEVIYFFISSNVRIKVVNVAICVDFNPLFHKNQRLLPKFKDFSPHHEETQLLLAENCSHKVINVCWRICVNYVVLIVKNHFSCEKFFIINNDLLLYNASLQFSKRKLCSFKSLVILGKYEVLCLFHLAGRQLEIHFKMILIETTLVFMSKSLVIYLADLLGFFLIFLRHL